MRHSRQIAYSLHELEQLIGISKRRIARVLSDNGVHFTLTGQQDKRLVFMSELERAMPELVDKIRFPSGGEE